MTNILISITIVQLITYLEQELPKELCKDYDITQKDGKCKFTDSDDELYFDNR